MTRLLLHPLMFRLIERYVWRALRGGDSVVMTVDSQGNIIVEMKTKSGAAIRGLKVPTRNPLKY